MDVRGLLVRIIFQASQRFRQWSGRRLSGIHVCKNLLIPMKLHSPFCISARLAPALRIGDAWISYERGRFVIDFPDGAEYVVTDFHPPQGAVHGHNDTPETMLQDCFRAILSFLGACAESRAYGRRRNGDPMAGENASLFPEYVGQWAEDNHDEIDMLAIEIEEAGQLITNED